MGVLHGQLRPWTTEELEKIHQASLRILENVGIQVESDMILDILEGTDAKVDRARRHVRFPREMVYERMKNCPGSRDLAPYPLGDFKVSCDTGAALIWDYKAGEHRPVTPRDLVDCPRLVQAMPNIDGASTLVGTMDVPAGMRDLVFYRNRMIHSVKKGGGGLGRYPSLCWEMGAECFDDVFDLWVAAYGRDQVVNDPDLSFFMGVASPLRWGQDVLETAYHVVHRGQIVGVGGNCTAGVQTPNTPASNIALDHAERLAGLCLITSMKADARFYFCNHPYMLDMTSGDVANGSPEQTLLALLGTQVLEHCGFYLSALHPILDAGSHVPDGQNSAEKAIYMLLTALGGARGIGGVGQCKEAFSYEQLVIDNEIAGYVKHLAKGAEINDDTLCLAAIEEYGIGGNFLDSDATIEYLREVYYPPQLFYRKRRSEWVREGSKDSMARAHEKVREILSSPTPIFMTADQVRAMDEVIERARQRLCPQWDSKPFLVDDPDTLPSTL
jgi:trimethylamine--corrinoid protein Co-methyltransferase